MRVAHYTFAIVSLFKELSVPRALSICSGHVRHISLKSRVSLFTTSYTLHHGPRARTLLSRYGGCSANVQDTINSPFSDPG